MLSEFQITYVTPKSTKGQAISNLLVRQPLSDEEEDNKGEFPNKGLFHLRP